jgi:MoaA/NifB/PqqE/SkfB family radical SAM enzyme
MGYTKRFSIFGMFRRAAIYFLAFIVKFTLLRKRNIPPQLVAKFLRTARPLIKDPLMRDHLSALLRRCHEDDYAFKLFSRFMSELSLKAKKGFVDTLVVHEVLLAHYENEKIAEKTGKPRPTWIAVSPLMGCNKSCIGCYANGYEDDRELTSEEFARVLKEAENLGIHIVCLTGGEPLMRKDFFLQLERRRHQLFLVFTNGELINDHAADQLAKLGNVVPMLSLEGPADYTDRRRGPGTFEKVTSTMTRLRKRGVFFGVSITIAKENAEAASSLNFIRDIVQRGALIGWYTLYLPLGAHPDVTQMAAPGQRLQLRENLKIARRNLPFFTVDMFNDGHFVNGCTGAGRQYFHINNRGYVEPCNFVHFSGANIRDMSLKEAIDQPFFQEFRRHQPFGDNLLLACPILDYPEKLRELLSKSDVKPSHPDAQRILETDVQEHLNEYARHVAKISRPVWEEEYAHWHKQRKALLEEE